MTDAAPPSGDALREDWDLVESVFHALSDIPQGEQSTAAQRLCGGNSWALMQVREMLAADHRSTMSKLGRIEDQAGEIMAVVHEAAGPLPPPDCIGPWRVGERLQSTRWWEEFTLRAGTADHSAPPATGERAVLMIFRGPLDHAVLAAKLGALAGAQSLARARGVAPIQSAGVLAGGRAYCVSAHPPGLGVVQYCDDARLTLPQRLALMRGVCAAVDALHEAGLSHGDLWSQCVPVSVEGGEPRPIVTLAGVMHEVASSSRAGDEGGEVEVGDAASTAPERAGAIVERHSIQPLSALVAADVYSLGAMLREIVVGHPVLPRSDLAHAGARRALEQIARHRVGSAAAELADHRDRARGAASARRPRGAGALIAAVRGDLDAVIGKALAHDPAQRYATARSLAEDIARVASGERVLARPDTWTYRCTHWCRRHRALAGVITVLIVVGLGWAAWYAFIAQTVPAARTLQE